MGRTARTTRNSCCPTTTTTTSMSSSLHEDLPSHCPSLSPTCPTTTTTSTSLCSTTTTSLGTSTTTTSTTTMCLCPTTPTTMCLWKIDDIVIRDKTEASHHVYDYVAPTTKKLAYMIWGSLIKHCKYFSRREFRF